uniref:Nuclear receptor domain-containing protein n=1 Tax=Caenorhabditis tropicalis TaxID=1561998 RepID=A0A1I7UVL7_9PELO
MSVPNNILSEVATVKNRGPSECSICYRPANGHHCEVASCKGCKTFFRRQCLSNSEINCKLNQDCFDIARKKLLNLRCQACRFKKCIEVGMNPLTLELNDNEKEAMNLQKILRNKQTKELEILILYSEELQFKTLIEMMIYLNEKIEQFRISEYNPSSLEFGTLEDMIKRENQFSFAEKFKQMPGWPMKRDEIQYNPIPERSKVRNIPDSRPLPFQKKHKELDVFQYLNGRRIHENIQILPSIRLV